MRDCGSVSRLGSSYPLLLSPLPFPFSLGLQPRPPSLLWLPCLSLCAEPTGLLRPRSGDVTPRPGRAPCRSPRIPGQAEGPKSSLLLNPAFPTAMTSLSGPSHLSEAFSLPPRPCWRPACRQVVSELPQQCRLALAPRPTIAPSMGTGFVVHRQRHALLPLRLKRILTARQVVLTAPARKRSSALTPDVPPSSHPVRSVPTRCPRLLGWLQVSLGAGSTLFEAPWALSMHRSH